LRWTEVEKEWKEFPIRVLVTATESGSSSALDVLVQCGISMQVRSMLVHTSRSIAELDGLGLARLGREIPVKQRGLSLSGLGKKIAMALGIFSLISVAVSLGLGAMVQRNFLNAAMGYIVGGEFLSDRWDHVLDSLELPVRQEIDRQLIAQAMDNGLPAAQRLGSLDPGTAEGRLVIALKQSDGAITLILPRQESVLEPAARALFLSGLGDLSERVEKAGDRVFVRFSRHFQRELASRLGLMDGGQIASGLLLSYPELASLMPKGTSYWNGTELTYYQHGNSILHFAYSKDGVVVNQGAGALPHEAIMEMMGASTIPPIYFWFPSWPYTFHEETRNGSDYWVYYTGESREGSWSGWSIAFDRKYSGGFPNVFIDNVPKSLYTLVSVQIGLAAILPLLILVLVCSPFIARRIARPVLAVRDALRSISDGDYSVRLQQDHLGRDEIGQLQQMVNHTAEELHKRESVKDLMGKYLSKQVADRILEGDSEGALAGVRKEVSVLFADVRGFTTYSEQHDPELVTKSLNEYFEVMVDVIAVHEGVLDKYIGDGLMVVFGAPMAQEDHARRAVITALEMQAALQSLNLKRLQRGDDAINIGIGVNTGLAISGNLGSLKRMEFTVIGDTVNTAARLESNAKQGQILIGRKTYEKVKDLIECESLGSIPVKGKAEPVEVWWLKGLKPRVRL